MSQYDLIATEYNENRSESTIHDEIESYTFVQHLLLPALGIKDVTTIDLKKVLAKYSVLDLACGGGHHTRKLKEEFGCENIVGVDISSKMIDIARAKEQADPLGIIYHVADVQDLIKPEKKFDFVTAFHLLNYARTRDELERIVQVISEQLKDSDNGYFLSINHNVCGDESIYNTDRYLKYGYRCEVQTPLVDGAQIKNIHLNLDGFSLSYVTYYLSPGIYEQAFQKAGFKHFQWVPVDAKREIDKCHDYIKHSPIIGILAHK